MHSPEELLELLIARKLTLGIARNAAKAEAQKWLDKKLAPKETLLSVPGVDYHVMMVRSMLCNRPCYSSLQV